MTKSLLLSLLLPGLLQSSATDILCASHGGPSGENKTGQYALEGSLLSVSPQLENSLSANALGTQQPVQAPLYADVPLWRFRYLWGLLKVCRNFCSTNGRVTVGLPSDVRLT